MWLAVGYLLLVAIAAVFVFMTGHEDRRKYLVSPVGPIEADHRPPYSPLPLRIVMVGAGFLALFDAVVVTFSLPPVLLRLVEGRHLPGPGAGLCLLNLAFDMMVLWTVWSSWRRNRLWLSIGIGLSSLALVSFTLLKPGLGLPRWHAGRFLGGLAGEYIGTMSLYGLWFLLACWTLFHLDSGATGEVVRDEELAGRTEPLSEAERVRVRWARGEMTAGERDSVLAGLEPDAS